MMADLGSGGKRKQLLITYNRSDVGPDVELWLDLQQNKSKSILFLISQAIKTQGMVDIIGKALDDSTLQVLNGESEVCKDGD